MRLQLLLAVAANAIFVVSSADYVSSSSSSETSSSSSNKSSSHSESRSTSSSVSSVSDNCDEVQHIKKCGKHEMYVDCPESVCRAQTCDDLGYDVECLFLGPDEDCPGPPGCICIKNYVRNSQGKCIPKEQCPSCGGDPNAVSGCGINCGKLCSNYNRTDVVCIQSCMNNGCDCKENYVLDVLTNKCVHPEQCSNSLACTKPNELLDLCPTPCSLWTCEDGDHREFACVSELAAGDPNCPPPVCRCNNGLYRNKNGDCVTYEECPDNTICTQPNEVYDLCPAPCPPRRCDVDDRVIRCAAPPQIGDPACEPGCRCADGYYRNYLGICVPRNECTTTICRKPNEVYDVCPAPCPPRRCDVNDALILCVVPPQPGDPECEPGCRCADGFAKNASDICIPREECPKCTAPNEVYDLCPAPCPPRRCDVDDRTIRCAAPPQFGDPECEPGCRCADGFYRNAQGICVTRNECNNDQCGTNEEFSDCPYNLCRPENCTQLGLPLECSPPIDGDCPEKSRCVCQAGYLRNDEGFCVPSSECPACGGDPNARAGCGVNCGRLCSNYFRDDVACILICYDNACDCLDGYVYDSNIKKCVLPEQCTPICSQNEVYSDCINGGCQAKNCSQIGEPVPCVKLAPESCIKGCLCQEGYLRAENGTCVPTDGCPRTQPRCGLNEIRVDCPSSIAIQNCSQLGFPIPLTTSEDSDTCSGSSGCVCEDGYLRNDDNICVPQSECPSCGGDPNAQSGCGGYCGHRCSTLNRKGPIACPAICRLNACDCKPGYVFDDNIGKCVIPAQCTPTCGSNEIYSDCINGGCQAKNCSQLGYPLKCPKIPADRCIKGCLCKDGYLRADNGTCIPKDQCPVTCKGQNEVYDACPPTCPPQICASIYSRYNCPLEPENRTCIGECRCKPGYYRNKINQCISTDDCLTCTGPNEYFSCGGACDNVCATLNEQNQTNCPIVNIVCNRMCYCEEGYARDENNTCIPINECKAPVCGNNEVYSNCIQGGCNPKNCSQIGQPIRCPRIDPTKCIKGCLCKEGYLRASNGTCIPQNQCPSCGENERYEECPNSCEAENCSQLGYPITCETSNDSGSCPVAPACVCIDGYVRNHQGRCIPKEQCPSCGGDSNAVSGCGVNCNKRCSDLNGHSNPRCIRICYPNACDCKVGYYYDDSTKKCVEPKHCSPVCGRNEVYTSCIQGECRAKNCTDLGKSISCPRIDPTNCIKGCLCQEGYLRASNGTCIPQNQCPSCGENETYEECPNSCKAENCSQLGYPITCDTSNDSGSCPVAPACVCVEGYMRNDQGRCIPTEQCPSCGGDSNAVSGCGVNCNQRCSDLNGRSRPCIRICYPNACDCKVGYYYDENISKCVKASECTPVCGRNEVYTSCIQGECRAKNCTDLGQPISCPRIDPTNCIKGCLCQEGYLRASNGTCIPQNQCPSPCTKPHEYYDSCAPICPPQTCEAIDKVYHCPISPANVSSCKGSCRCEQGYYRNKIGECISKDNCQRCTGPHEYYSCGSACDNECATIDTQNKTVCPIVNIVCNEKCYCEDGYARNENNICIPINKCKVCGENEMYDECPTKSCEPEYCSQLGYPQTCETSDDSATCLAVPACVCVPGYVKNRKGKCILKEQCPSCGGDSNAISGCGVNCNKHCADLNGKPRLCPRICYPNACDCKYGYYYNDNIKKCVKPESCSLQCGQNETYVDCPPCQAQTCSDLGFPLKCSSDSCYGGPACICNDGYVRDDLGRCIPVQECPSCGGDPNAVSGCGVNCYKHCSNIGQEPDLCIDICYPNSCDCKEGFYYDDNVSKCVGASECTTICGENEVFDDCINGGCDMRNCSQLGRPTICINPLECIGGCLCREDYLRDDNNVCIPEDQCPAAQRTAVSQCGVNEIYVQCPPTVCQPQNCSQIGYPVPCVDLSKDGRCPEEPACICVDGYVRDETGNCVPEQECLSCGGDPNAEAGCGVNCNKRCSDYNKEPGICILACNENGCDCKEGFYYDDYLGKCVLPEDCTPDCKKNERYDQCPANICQPENCSQLGFPLNCTDSSGSDSCPGEPGCVCLTGYVRNSDGNCIPARNCPSCGGDPNAVAGCGVNCNKHCSNIGQEPGFCILACFLNACDCKENYYYDDNLNECVLPEDCTPTCGPDEVYTDCVNGGCEIKNCSQLGQPVLCIDLIECIPGCNCKDGYLRDDNGTCVPEYKCQLQCTKPHEVYDSCPPTCPPQTCESLNETYFCPFIPANRSAEDCHPACRCEPGYYRNSNGDCITEDDCKICTGPNEFFSCGGACDNVCATLNEQNQTNCPIVNIVCNRMCYCVDGYARDENNICIPIDECKEPQCGENERYEKCPVSSSQPQTCSDLGFPVDCQSCQSNKPGCVCVDGYVRDMYNKCIPRTECPSCGGDPNAVSGCGVNCNKHCSDIGKEPGFCIEICYDNACDCKEGFYFDDNTDTCVLPNECTTTCGKNEVYSTCINGGCDMRNCSQLGKPTLCIDPLECIDGCVCEDGYLRNCNNVCVPDSQCDCPITSIPITESTPTESPSADEVNEDVGYLEKGDSAFSNKLVYQLLQDRNESFAVSSLSILMPLGQLELFAQELTKEQILNAIGLSTDRQVEIAYREVLNRLKDQQSVVIELSNTIYVNDKYTLTNRARELIPKIFDVALQEMDFGQAEESASTINKNVAEDTHNRIQNLVSPDMFNEDTRLVLVNALYFKGNWTHPFMARNTKDSNFYGSVTKQVPMMNQKFTSVLYGEDDEKQVLVLPFQGGNFTAAFILTRSNDTNVLKTMSGKFAEDSDFVNNTFGNLSYHPVDVSIPKFEMFTTIDLGDLFKKVNLDSLLDPAKEPFIGLIEEDTSLYMSSGVHKTFVEINEFGAEGAAATAITISVTSAVISEPEFVYVFNADHPFIFYLSFRGYPVFSGVYRGDV